MKRWRGRAPNERKVEAISAMLQTWSNISCCETTHSLCRLKGEVLPQQHCRESKSEVIDVAMPTIDVGKPVSSPNSVDIMSR